MKASELYGEVMAILKFMRNNRPHVICDGCPEVARLRGLLAAELRISRRLSRAGIRVTKEKVALQRKLERCRNERR